MGIFMLLILLMYSLDLDFHNVIGMAVVLSIIQYIMKIQVSLSVWVQSNNWDG